MAREKSLPSSGLHNDDYVTASFTPLEASSKSSYVVISSLRVLLLFPCVSVALPLFALALGRSVLLLLLLLLFFLLKTSVNMPFWALFEYIQVGVIPPLKIQKKAP